MHPRTKDTPVKQPFVYSKSEFEQIVSQYQDVDLTCRIDNIIVKNAKKHALVRGEEYSFNLNWPDSADNPHTLKVTFSRADHFGKKYSWIMDEKTLLTQFSVYAGKNIQLGQRYCSLSVKEISPSEKKRKKYKHKKNEIEILSVWMAMDGLVGELRDLKKGKYFSGNDILAIYSCFDQIFKIKSTLICDESRLADKKDNIRIPLRLLSALCTGKTWYEAKLPGVKLFECHKFKSAYNGLVTQNSMTRNQALQELRELRLSTWYKMLDQTGKLTLNRLFLMLRNPENQLDKNSRRSLRLFIHRQQNIINFGKATLHELTTVLFNDSKKKRILTRELEEFSYLLCGSLNHDYKEKVSKSESDFWVKSRVREILWGGYFWIKEASHVETKVEKTAPELK